MLYQTEAQAENPFGTYKVPDLEPNHIYYVKVRAINSKGEGYVPDQPTFVRTMETTLSEPGSLYVWGNNQHSEIGLTDDQVEENKDSYVKCRMTKPVKHAMFNAIVYDVAPGNITTLFHCVNKETQDTFVVMCGSTAMLKDGEDEIERNELMQADINKFEDVSSIPFMVDFDIPVVKVACGNMFAGMLTAEGTVFTWGLNEYGQLGLKQEKTMYVQRPNKINFVDHHSDSSGKPQYIKDI